MSCCSNAKRKEEKIKVVPMLSAINKGAIVLDVKTVTHNSQKRKLLLMEDGKCIQN